MWGDVNITMHLFVLFFYNPNLTKTKSKSMKEQGFLSRNNAKEKK